MVNLFTVTNHWGSKHVAGSDHANSSGQRLSMTTDKDVNDVNKHLVGNEILKSNYERQVTEYLRSQEVRTVSQGLNLNWTGGQYEHALCP